MLPLATPRGVRHLFERDEFLTRLAPTANWTKDTKLLELGLSGAGIAFARTLGCQLTIVTDGTRDAAAAQRTIESYGVDGQTTLLTKVPTEGIYDGIISFERILGPMRLVASRFRPLLSRVGFLGLCCAARVVPPNTKPAEGGFYTQCLKASVGTLTQTLEELVELGFEPELVEVADAEELENFYSGAHAALPAGLSANEVAAFEAELASYREQVVGHPIPVFIVASRWDGAPREVPYSQQ